MERIESVAERVEADPKLWPQAVEQVSRREFLAHALSSQELIELLLSFEADEPAESNSLEFLKGALLFEALYAIEAFTQTQEGLAYLLEPLRSGRGPQTIATALPQPGSHLSVASDAMFFTEDLDGPMYAPIIKDFTTKVLTACDPNPSPGKKVRWWMRLEAMLTYRFAGASKLNIQRLEHSAEQLDGIRATAFSLRGQYRKHLNEFAEAEGDLKQSLAQLDRLPPDSNRELFRARNWSHLGALFYLQMRERDAVEAYGKAVEMLDKAIAIDPTAAGDWNYPYALHQRRQINLELRDLRMVLADDERAIAELGAAAMETTLGSAQVWLDRGYTNARMNRLAAALDDLSRGVAIATALAKQGNPSALRLVARGRHNRGYALLRLQRFDEAIADLSGALEAIGLVFKDDPIEMERSQASIYLNRGSAFAGQGRAATALWDLNQAVDIYRRTAVSRKKGDLLDLAVALRDRGLFLFNAHMLEEALSDLNEVADIYDRFMRVEQPPADLIRRFASGLAPLCAAQMKAGQHENALKNAHMAVDSYRELVHILGHTDLQADLATAYQNRGELYSRLNRLEEAERDLARAIELFRTLACGVQSGENTAALGGSLSALGNVKYKCGAAKEAAEFLEQAAQMLETGVELAITEQDRRFRRASHADILDNLVFIACEMAESLATPPPVASPGRGVTWAERAAYWAEHARARNLGDILSAAEQTPAGITPDAYDAYLARVRDLRDIDFRLRDLEEARSQAQHAAQRNALSAKITELSTARDAVVQSMRDDRQRFVEQDANWAPGADSLTMEEIQQTAATSRAGLLTLRPGDKGIGVVLTTPGGSTHARTLSGFKLEDLARLAVSWRNVYQVYRELPYWDRGYKQAEVKWQATVDSTIAELRTKVWSPLSPWLRQHLGTGTADGSAVSLVVLPGRILSGLPVHAAVSQESDSASGEWRISFAPSIRVLSRHVSVPRDFRLLAVRNPTAHVSWTDLSWADLEVDEACMVAPEHLVLADANHPQFEPATRDRLKRELPNYSVALMATHGVYDEQHPWTNSGLHTADFTGAAAGSGLLTIRDFYDMDLSRTKLLLLTACESALAQSADSTGEQLGIPSAILASGAGAVIGSLWLVEDVATALLVRQIFMEMKGAEAGGGSDPAAALARAQRWLRQLTLQELDVVFAQLDSHSGRFAEGQLQQVRQGLSLRGAHPFSHPVCWAGFVCYGWS